MSLHGDAADAQGDVIRRGVSAHPVTPFGAMEPVRRARGGGTTDGRPPIQPGAAFRDYDFPG